MDFRPYFYRGSNFEVDDGPEESQYAPNGCGTYPGYRTHIRHKTKPCDGCRDANRVYCSKWYAQKREKRAASKKYQPQPRITKLPDIFDATLCGSMQGYRQHIKHKQKQCRGCLDAQNTYQNQRKARKQAENAVRLPA